MFVCQLRLATQPSLAGIKHLNRLENVLARSENSAPDMHEGLLLDMQDQVIECTSGNLFARYQDQLITPALSHCGVAGVMRDWLLDNAAQFGLQAKVGELHLAQLLLADELIMTNSVLGAIQIKQIQHKIWPALSLAQQIRNLLIKQ
jgi:4-amino-4-deoxychorismate lyase